MVEIGKSKILPIHPKSPNFQSRCQNPISKVQKLSYLKGIVPDLRNYYYLDNKMLAYLNLGTVESFKIKFLSAKLLNWLIIQALVNYHWVPSPHKQITRNSLPKSSGAYFLCLRW
jgi:hypothetical protein